MRNQTDYDPIIRLDQACIIPISDAAAHPLRRMEGCWSSMGTGEWFSRQQLFLLSALHALQKERERFPGLGLKGSTGRRRRRALITDAQEGPIAVAPAAGHLGASLTPTLSKNKKIRKGKWGHN